MFPSNYVRLIEINESVAETQDEITVPDGWVLYTTSHRFETDKANELAFDVGDRLLVSIKSITETDASWWKARRYSDKSSTIGFVPSNYLRRLASPEQ